MKQVKVLEGGVVDWSAFEEMSKEAVTPKPGNVTLKQANRAMFVEWTAVYDDVVSRRDPNVVLLDARPHDMYTGAVIKDAIRGGHIPGAINVVSLEGTSAQRWKSDEKLREVYAPVDLNVINLSLTVFFDTASGIRGLGLFSCLSGTCVLGAQLLPHRPYAAITAMRGPVAKFPRKA